MKKKWDPFSALCSNGGVAQRAVAAALRAVAGLWDVTGPKLPFAMTSRCCGAARHYGHSFIVRHFVK